VTVSGCSMYSMNSPEEILRVYLESQNNLYDKTRIRNTKSFLVHHLPLEAMNVLEIGCGGGLWSAFFAHHASAVTCCDIREHIVEAAKIHVFRSVDPLSRGKIRWVAGNIMEREFPESFDFAFLKDVLEHVDDDLAFMNRLSDLLTPGGYLYIATQNSLSLNYLFERFYYNLRGHRNWCGWDPTHLRFYQPRSLKSLARKSRFRATSWHGMYHFPYRFISRLLFHEVREHDMFHIIENIGGEYWPFSRCGWSIGVLLRKEPK